MPQSSAHSETLPPSQQAGPALSADTNSERSNVMLVEDHPVIREGIRLFLENSGRYTVCAEASRTEEVLDVFATVRPKVVLLDLLLEGKDSLSLISRLIESRADCRVLVFSMLQETVYAERALRAGAAGYIMKSAAPAEFLLALDTVSRGKIYLTPKTFARIFREARREGASSEALSQLSDRELQLFQMIGAGMPNREIAALLRISVKTVEAHRENIKNKLSLADAAELTAAAERFVTSVQC